MHVPEQPSTTYQTLHYGSSSSESSMSSVASSSGMVATSVVSSFGHDVVGVRVVLQLPHVRQAGVYGAGGGERLTSDGASGFVLFLSVNAASAAKFAFGVEEVTSWACDCAIVAVLGSTRLPLVWCVWSPGSGWSVELFVCRPIVGAIPSHAAASGFAYSLAVDAVWFGQLIGGTRLYCTDAFAEVVVGANGVKHSVCRFGGIGGVSLIEVSSALGELNCRCRCSPMGVEVSS
eukprot:g61103.t1